MRRDRQKAEREKEKRGLELGKDLAWKFGLMTPGGKLYNKTLEFPLKFIGAGCPSSWINALYVFLDFYTHELIFIFMHISVLLQQISLSVSADQELFAALQSFSVGPRVLETHIMR